jgi:hypothetical protein
LPTAVRTYFAAEDESLIGRALCGRLERLLVVNSSSVQDSRDKWVAAYNHYYGDDAAWGGITYGASRAGDQGELAAIRVNKARAYAKALQALVTGAKVTWRTRARTSDAGAAAAATLGNNILQELWTQRDLQRLFLRWVEVAIAFGSAYAFAPWDTTIGPPLAAMDDVLHMQGDVALNILPPWDVWRDPTLKNPESSNWAFVVTYQNRFDLAKQHKQLVNKPEATPQEVEDAILCARVAEVMDPSRRCRDDDSELIPVWHFFHRRSPALPAGREVTFLSSDVVLTNRALTSTYGDIPLVPLYADEKLDTAEGWTSYWDGLGIQEVQDAIQTSLATNVTTLGNPTVFTEVGTDIPSGDELGRGFRVVTIPKGAAPPQTLELSKLPPQVLEYVEQLDASHKQLLGLNDVALGQPQSAQMNAQAFAVLAAMAVQQASPFQSAAFTALSKLGTSVLKTLGKNVTTERMVRVTGKSSQALYSVQRYSGESLSPIDGAEVTIGNPMEQTPAGRMQLLEILRNIDGVIQTSEQVYQVMETGRLEPQFRQARDEQNLIQAEYELLQQGKNPTVHSTQNHLLHYRENAAVLLNPDVLGNPRVVAAVQQHLDAHYLEYFGVAPGGDPVMGAPPDPLRLQRQRFLLGQGPEPMPMAPPGMPGAPGAPGAPMDGAAAPPPEPGSPFAPGGPEALGPPSPPPLPVAQPQMPLNPMTGQPFELGTGGGVVPLQ